MRRVFVIAVVAIAVSPGFARDKKRESLESLGEYIASLPTRAPAAAQKTPGSLWEESAALSDLSSDFKARRAGDVVIVRIVEQTVAEASGSVATQRNFDASSGVTGLAGGVSTANFESLFSPQSASKLQGQGQTASKSRLLTSLSGQVVATLPGGAMVVQAERQILMNNERQSVVVRGVVRPNDIGSDNSVVSTMMSNLEIELKGKGVISDSTRPPNWVVRTILKVLGF